MRSIFIKAFIVVLICSPVALRAASTDTDPSAPAPAPAAPQAVVAGWTAPDGAPARNVDEWPLGYYPGDPLPPKTVYFTFDDGPTDFTGEILDILKEENVKATFFLNSYDKDDPERADTSKNILLRYALVLKRMVAEGHAIGNHTYSHQDLACLTPKQIDFQFSFLEKQLKEVLGDKAPPLYLLRPPFGSPWYGAWGSKGQKKNASAAIKDRGIVLMWSLGWDSKDSKDWAKGEWYKPSKPRYHPDNASYKNKMTRMTEHILKQADGAAGGIILMHDTHPTSRDVLKQLIVELRKRGYSFGTLDEYCRWRWGQDVFDRFKAKAPVAAR